MALPLALLIITRTLVIGLAVPKSRRQAQHANNAFAWRHHGHARPDHVGKSTVPHLRREANVTPPQLEADIEVQNTRGMNSLLSVDPLGFALGISPNEETEEKRGSCTTFVEVDGNSSVLDSFWGEACRNISANATMIRLRMGRVVDFFKPGAGQDMCSMLKNGTGFEWSNDGKTWVSVPPPENTTLGGSQRHWPSDGRSHLSFWGQKGTDGYTGGCCHYQPDGTDTADWGRAFAVDYCETEEKFNFQHAGDCTDFANVSAETAATEAFWAAKCDSIPSEAVCVRETMGTAVDYFMPVPGSNVCEMLKTSWYQYLWSPDGVKWQVPIYHQKKQSWWIAIKMAK